MHQAITKLVRPAKRNRVPLRQSHPRPAKRAHGRRYTHDHQFRSADFVDIVKLCSIRRLRTAMDCITNKAAPVTPI